YDAGDHIKFAYPMAAALTVLAWGGIENPKGYSLSGQWPHLLDAVRWGADWLLKAHPAPDIFHAQVGDSRIDHASWLPPEKMKGPRPVYTLDPARPGSDAAGEAAAALAAASLLFSKEDPAYSARLLAAAESLYDFANRYRGAYCASIPNAAGHYRSHNGWMDELAWAAAWLHAATGEPGRLAQAEAFYSEAVREPLAGAVFSWDDKRPGLAVLLARLTLKPQYLLDAESFLNSWVDGTHGVKKTPGGLAWRDPWGSLRYAANAAFLAGIYSDSVRDPLSFYSRFARRQVDYILGKNPARKSYIIGFGRNHPRNPHHRASHASPTGSIEFPLENTHLLAGALVGGPVAPDDFSHHDDRRDMLGNEAALDYNAGLTGALARLAEISLTSPPPATAAANASTFHGQ
ncbi:MAG: glycoside hydrolase family 9 protein, partial [Terrimicrobiaceae bacterium]|nr:glycoside hydrolase family 9 protein [Terrimicrobiaceae bacterium]